MVELNLMPILRSFDRMRSPAKTRMALAEPFVSRKKLPFRLCYAPYHVSRQLSYRHGSCCSPGFPTSDSMHRHFRQTMQEIRSKISLDIISLGSASEVCKKQHPDIRRYGDAFGHPSREIAFLTALLYYRMVTGKRPAQSRYDAGLAPDAGPKLRTIAAMDFD